MGLVEQHKAPQSTLADVIGQVKDAFDEMGNATEILVGANYLAQFGVGGVVGGRVLFVPESDGSVGDPIEMGDICSIEHGCQVFVRSDPGLKDEDRFKHAYVLGDLVMSCIQAAGTGRITWRDHGDSSPEPSNTYGAELTFGFSYKRAVRHAAKRFALDAAAPNPKPAQPRLPTGEAGTLDSIDYDAMPVA